MRDFIALSLGWGVQSWVLAAMSALGAVWLVADALLSMGVAR